MSQILEFTKLSDARASLKSIYDTAGSHIPVNLQREGDEPLTIVHREDLRNALSALVKVKPVVSILKNGSASIWLEGLPISAEGKNLSLAEKQLIKALRAYADTWVEELRYMASHRSNWALVNLIIISDDEALQKIILGE